MEVLSGIMGWLATWLVVLVTAFLRDLNRWGEMRAARVVEVPVCWETYCIRATTLSWNTLTEFCAFVVLH